MLIKEVFILCTDKFFIKELAYKLNSNYKLTSFKNINALPQDPDLLVFIDLKSFSAEEIDLDHLKNIVLISEYKSDAYLAYKMNAKYFLLRDLEVKEIQKALDISHHFSDESTIKKVYIVNHNFRSLTNKKINFNESEVLFVMADRDYTYLFLRQKNKINKYLLAKSLSTIEKIFSPKVFFKVHRQYLVNLDQIEIYGTYPTDKIKLKGTDLTIPLARRRKLDFHNKCNQK